MITASLNGIQMPPIEQQFLERPMENAQDVDTLDGNIYTDFISLNKMWVFNYTILTEDEYNAFRDAYEAQFAAPYEYPLLSIPYYGITDQPARMYINDKDIWNNCGSVQNLQIQFRLTDQTSQGSI